MNLYLIKYAQSCIKVKAIYRAYDVVRYADILSDKDAISIHEARTILKDHGVLCLTEAQYNDMIERTYKEKEIIGV